jgi:predicted transcriptional regulator
MPKSKLEIYVDVLKIIAQNYSFEISRIADALSMGTKELKICLTFLVKQGLVDKRKVCNCKVDYLITQQGIGVLRHFNEIEQGVPLIGEIRVS